MDNIAEDPHGTDRRADAGRAPVSQLQATDWNAEWIDLQKRRRRADDASFWDKRAKEFGAKDTPSRYVAEFLELAQLRPGESVLDMGCGTGGLAIPLAQAGHPVIAADFSRSMLEKLEDEMARSGTSGIDVQCLAWADDWERFGLAPRSVDVAFASRSIATDDLRDALGKLNRTARRRCCITLCCASSPRTDAAMLAECGIADWRGRDYQYAWNILVNEGLEPTCAYIHSARKETFDSFEEAFAHRRRMVADALRGREEMLPEAEKRVRAWLETSLVPNETAGKLDDHGVAEKQLRLSRERMMNWAFIAWEADVSKLA